MTSLIRGENNLSWSPGSDVRLNRDISRLLGVRGQESVSNGGSRDRKGRTRNKQRGIHLWIREIESEQRLEKKVHIAGIGKKNKTMLPKGRKTRETKL